MRIRFEENASPDIAQAARENYIVILPLCCIEQHGPALPVGSDYSQPIEAAELAARKHGAGVLVLPALPFGPAAEHIRFAGTISLSFEAWSHVVIEILENLVRDGFRRIVITKGCGGHMGIEGPVYQYYCRMRREVSGLDIRVFAEQAWEELGRIIRESGLARPGGVHADGIETSMILARRPDLVHLDRLAKPMRQGSSWSGTWWVMEDLSDTGATGDPACYSVDLGRKIHDRMNEVLADFLGQMWKSAGQGAGRGVAGETEGATEQ